MNYIDIILGILLLWGLIRGVSKGLLVSLASLLALIAGVYFAVHFSHIVADYLSNHVQWNENTLKLSAFAITFIIVVIGITLIGKILTKIADFAALGILNKLLGGVFGVLKIAFILSAFMMLFDAGNKHLEIIPQDTIDESMLYPHIQVIAPAILPNIIEEVKKEKATEV
ncbi:CvpA family protein [Aquimarina rhabdastrellae]